MPTINPGDVVTTEFVGASGVKRRPAVVISSLDYHVARPDVVLGVLTSNIASATTAMDYVLLDWSAAGLHVPSAFRSYFGMAQQAHVRVIGHLSEGDWAAVRRCMTRAIER